MLKKYLSFENLSKTSKAKLGNSLLELVIIIAVLCFISLLVIPVLKVNDSVLAKIELERLYAYSLFLHRCSMVTGKDKTLKFELKNNSYYVDGKLITLNSAICFDILPSMHGPPSQPAKTLEKPITFKKEKVIFYQNGKATPGLVCLANKDKTILYALSIGVGKFPYIRCYEYLNNKWKILEIK